MSINNNAITPQLKAIKTTDLSPFIRMAGLMTPRLLDGFKQTLDQKQKMAFEKVMPVGGEKKIFLQLVGTPTLPIVIGFADPLKMSLMAETEIRHQKIKGIKLTLNDIQALSESRVIS
jgi:hypothetical protein